MSRAPHVLSILPYPHTPLHTPKMWPFQLTPSHVVIGESSLLDSNFLWWPCNVTCFLSSQLSPGQQSGNLQDGYQEPLRWGEEGAVLQGQKWLLYCILGPEPWTAYVHRGLMQPQMLPEEGGSKSRSFREIKVRGTERLFGDHRL